MTNDQKTITATPKEMAAAFTEWERRFRENPKAFMSDMERLSNDEGTQGDLSAAFFIELLEEISPPSV